MHKKNFHHKNRTFTLTVFIDTSKSYIFNFWVFHLHFTHMTLVFSIFVRRICIFLIFHRHIGVYFTTTAFVTFMKLAFQLHLFYLRRHNNHVCHIQALLSPSNMHFYKRNENICWIKLLINEHLINGTEQIRFQWEKRHCHYHMNIFLSKFNSEKILPIRIPYSSFDWSSDMTSENSLIFSLNKKSFMSLTVIVMNDSGFMHTWVLFTEFVKICIVYFWEWAMVDF